MSDDLESTRETRVLLGRFRTRSMSDARRVRLVGRGTIEQFRGVVVSRGVISYEESKNCLVFILQGEEQLVGVQRDCVQRLYRAT